MELYPNHELIYSFCKGIERLFTREEPWTMAAAHNLLNRIQAAIMRWEQAVLENCRQHQKLILEHIEADGDISLECDPIIPYEIFDDPGLPWNWPVGDLVQEASCINQRPPRAFSYILYICIDRFNASSGFDTLFGEHAFTLTRMEFFHFLTELQISMYAWKHATEEQNDEWQKRILTRLSNGEEIAQYSDPELLDPDFNDPSLPWNNLNSHSSMVDTPPFQEAEGLSGNLTLTTPDYASEVTEGHLNSEFVSLTGVEIGNTNLDETELHTLAMARILLRERINNLLDALGAIGIQFLPRNQLS
ncbi:hypothetical protein N7532_004285 [Penicillium argentinense]|uniref:Uncharacterized protein n=1 Tax=Penicillium argentinense TaxID=1131581 RepID=A0A9W9KFC8_9EURO|nr:uncharacterized protein N7532_004285 [Penicillium argentinense]KAJ5103756.1 hypothetical protein N7532_004285 [Penicillium argentinense]